MGSALSLFFLLIIILLFSSLFISYYFLFKNRNLDFYLKLLYGFLYSFFIIVSLFFLSSIRNEIYFLYHDSTEVVQKIEYIKNNKQNELIFESVETTSINKVIRMRYIEKDSDNFTINLLLGDVFRIIYKNERLIWIQSRTGFYCIELELGIILINESNENRFITINNNHLWIYEWNKKNNTNNSGLIFKVYDMSNPSPPSSNIILLDFYPLINDPIKDFKVNYSSTLSGDKIFEEINSIDITTKKEEKYSLDFKTKPFLN